MDSKFHWWYIALGFIFLVMVGAIGWKMVQRTESNVYKAGSLPVNPETRNYGFIVLQPGCINVKAQEARHAITDSKINNSHK